MGEKREAEEEEEEEHCKGGSSPPGISPPQSSQHPLFARLWGTHTPDPPLSSAPPPAQVSPSVLFARGCKV